MRLTSEGCFNAHWQKWMLTKRNTHLLWSSGRCRNHTVLAAYFQQVSVLTAQRSLPCGLDWGPLKNEVAATISQPVNGRMIRGLMLYARQYPDGSIFLIGKKPA